MLDKSILAMLRCPVSGGELQLDADNQRLLSPDAQLAYPIQEGMPQLLAEEALPLSGDSETAG